MITRSLLAIAAFFAAGTGLISMSGAAAVTRETVFEFAEMPQVKKGTDKWTVTFATKSACDVTVAVEDSAGRIMNFIEVNDEYRDPANIKWRNRHETKVLGDSWKSRQYVRSVLQRL